MRVLFVNQYFPPDVSATAYLLGELAEDLATDHEVWVLAGRPSYDHTRGRYRPRGVAIRRAPSTSFGRTSMAGRLANYGTYAASSLARGRRLPRPDVVVAMTDPPFAGLIGRTLARRYRVPFIWILEDIFPDVAVALAKLRNRALIDLWSRLNRRLRESADRLVAVGRDMVEKLEREGVPRGKIALIPNWATPRSVEQEELTTLRRTQAWEDRFVVMHAGNLGLAQDLPTTIRAAASLRDDTDTVFAFLGDGAARRRLEEEATRLRLSNVRFLPSVPKEQAHTYIAAADLHLITLAPGLGGCVAPSKLYGILAAGRPYVAATDPGSEPALVAEEHGCGFAIPPRDPRALARTILRARSAPLEEMGAKGSAAFAQKYQRRHAVAAYRSLLADVVTL